MLLLGNQEINEKKYLRSHSSSSGLVASLLLAGPRAKQSAVIYLFILAIYTPPFPRA